MRRRSWWLVLYSGVAFSSLVEESERMCSGTSSVPKISSGSKSRLKTKEGESCDCNQEQGKEFPSSLPDFSPIKPDWKMLHPLLRQSNHPQQRSKLVMMQFLPEKVFLAELVVIHWMRRMERWVFILTSFLAS
jgi:hypothetical protein